MMKIIHVVPSFGLGGMEKVICSVINHTAAYYDHEVLVLNGSIEAKKWIENSNVKLQRLPRYKSKVKNFISLYKSLKRKNPDVLMSYNWGGTDSIWLGRISGIKNIIHSEHGFNFDESRKTILKRDIIRFILYRIPQFIVVVSHDFYRILEKRYRINKYCIAFIANGVDSEIYKPNSVERTQVRKALGIDEDDFVIGFTGRLDPVKNFDLMLDIFEKCTALNNNVKLVIVGDGPELKTIKKRCDVRDLTNHIFLLGEKGNVVPYLQAMDVFLLTSVSEQMPMTILEAMSTGLPVVASRVGEIPHLITHGQEGYVWELNEGPECFVQSLLSLKQSEKRYDMGQAARHKVLTTFREEKVIVKYRHLIDSIASLSS